SFEGANGRVPRWKPFRESSLRRRRPTATRLVVTARCWAEVAGPLAMESARGRFGCGVRQDAALRDPRCWNLAANPATGTKPTKLPKILARDGLELQVNGYVSGSPRISGLDVVGDFIIGEEFEPSNLRVEFRTSKLSSKLTHHCAEVIRQAIQR